MIPFMFPSEAGRLKERKGDNPVCHYARMTPMLAKMMCSIEPPPVTTGFMPTGTRYPCRYLALLLLRGVGL